MNPATVYIGIDVSKDHLDLDLPDGKPARIRNTKPEITKLAARVKALGRPALLCCESTGGYERLLLDTLTAAGIGIARANPGHVRHYAKSGGHLAKTDALDARLLTRFAQERKPAPYRPPAAGTQRLQRLLDRRAQLTGLRTQEKNRLHQTRDAETANSIKAVLKAIATQLDAIEEKLRALFKAPPAADTDAATPPTLHARYTRLLAIPGIGPVSARALLGYLPELGTDLTDRQLTSLAGLAPWANDSGKARGARAIRGGRAHARTALYMPAFVAAQHNPILAGFYERLRARGKPHNLALTAVMRKLLCLAHRLLSDPNFKLTPHEKMPRKKTPEK